MSIPCDPSSASAPAPLSRADRARRNGAVSRGPVSAEGKARAWRNALRHGLRARLHVVVEPEDDAAFEELGTRLFAELAPSGELEGFLVARLAAAIWKTGRAERLEAQALQALTGPDPTRLGLALRYQGSVAREFSRSLRELRRLREAPLGEVTPAGAAVARESVAASTPEPLRQAPGDVAAALAEDDPARAAAEPPDGHPRGLPPVAVLAAWGGPRPPRGCLYLRPVPHYPPRTWHQFQQCAHPAAEPVLVDMQGNLLEPGGAPPVPPAAEPPPCAIPVRASRQDEAQAPPSPSGGLRHGLTAADLRGDAGELGEPRRASAPPAGDQPARAEGALAAIRPNEPSPDDSNAPCAAMPERGAGKPGHGPRPWRRLLRQGTARLPTGVPPTRDPS